MKKKAAKSTKSTRPIDPKLKDYCDRTELIEEEIDRMIRDLLGEMTYSG